MKSKETPRRGLNQICMLDYKMTGRKMSSRCCYGDRKEDAAENKTQNDDESEKKSNLEIFKNEVKKGKN